MINTYLYDPKNKKLGFTFCLFENRQFINDYDSYASLVDMNVYFKRAKSDVIGINMEKFISYCEENILSSTALIDELLSNLKKACRWRVDNKEKYINFIELVLRGEKFMIDIINSLPKDVFVEALMMYKVIINFCLDEKMYEAKNVSNKE